MLRSKDTNPKDAVGTAKVPRSTISAPVMGEVGLAMLEGARKYGRHNYRVAGVRASVYYDATNRHLDDWWEGVDIDPDSGIHHLSKAIASLMTLRDSMIQGNWIDDRPPKSPRGWQQEQNEKAKEIIERYPDAKPPCLAKDYPRAEGPSIQVIGAECRSETTRTLVMDEPDRSIEELDRVAGEQMRAEDAAARDQKRADDAAAHEAFHGGAMDYR